GDQPAERPAPGAGLGHRRDGRRDGAGDHLHQRPRSAGDVQRASPRADEPGAEGHRGPLPEDEQSADRPRRAGAAADHPGDHQRDFRGDRQTHSIHPDRQAGIQLGVRLVRGWWLVVSGVLITPAIATAQQTAPLEISGGYLAMTAASDGYPKGYFVDLAANVTSQFGVVFGTDGAYR